MDGGSGGSGEWWLGVVSSGNGWWEWWVVVVGEWLLVSG